ncbi:MAG: Rrf2 family transcriptional regulator [Clostridiaceae bacterium]|jgi:Rrf2 family protein|nr:Rrf2 family transcriptional regulator [Clostridiaceae bacterium]
MKISTRGQYGLEALVYLALNTSSGPVSIKNIAQYCGMSEAYILQIFLVLRRAGIISSMRGAQGGYMLSRDSAEITVKEVLETLEGPLALVECVAVGCEETCIRYEMCCTRLLWEKISERLALLAGSITIADLVDHFQKIDAMQNPDYCI